MPYYSFIEIVFNQSDKLLKDIPLTKPCTEAKALFGAKGEITEVIIFGFKVEEINIK